MTHLKERASYVLSMLLLTNLLAACATPSPVFVASSLQLPQKPAVELPKRHSSYSANARINIEKWQKQLTDSAQAQQP